MTPTETKSVAKVSVIAGLPLALLESVRAHDRPGEILEDEDLTVSLPRRLGLKGVVLSQIRRYEEAHAAGKNVPGSDVISLLQLVLRRPDAEAILRDTGQRVARFRYERVSRTRAGLLRALPGSLVFIPIRRAARRLLRRIGSNDVRIAGKPLVLRVSSSLTTDLDSLGCTLYTGALEELVLLYSGKPRSVIHSVCLARGEEFCEWQVR